MTDEVQFDGWVWSNLGERGNLLAGEGWRYVRDKGPRHLFDNRPGRSWCMSRCGIELPDEEWRGTGSQEEYERLASRPKCLRCMRSL
ncbi:MAG TPA: hypothetical protein VK735_39785 [Pseudonocardia sp.]|uniref:hypothetical protein n=1 Tax=Pseudonocardia sp. TaxID=60912 RepID=UPI002CB7DB72|nr:hypothetical protein [Pseudonocardia sp.]HTF53625.1 hypothetical protein [Pseudonocardia sp.]